MRTISTEKTVRIVILKEPIQIINKIIEQVLEMNYLGVKLMSHRLVEEEVRKQINKAVLLTPFIVLLTFIDLVTSFINQKTPVPIYWNCLFPESKISIRVDSTNILQLSHFT